MGDEDAFVSLHDRSLQFLRAPRVLLDVVAEGLSREISFGAFGGTAQIIELFFKCLSGDILSPMSRL